LSPFFRRRYSEFHYTHSIYNHVIHPQWDFIDSETLFCKVLYANYEKGFAVIEMMGEWNDAIGNDIRTLRKELIDPMIEAGITKFILIGENILIFHGDDESYYEDWYDEIKESEGWIMTLNFRPHVVEEMRRHRLHHYMYMGDHYNDIEWRKVKPFHILQMAEDLLFKQLE